MLPPGPVRPGVHGEVPAPGVVAVVAQHAVRVQRVAQPLRQPGQLPGIQHPGLGGEELLHRRLVFGPHRGRQPVHGAPDHRRMRGRDRPLGLRRGQQREHRVDRLPGQRAPRPDLGGRLDPLRGLTPGDDQQLGQQHRGRRAAQLTGHPTRFQLADHNVIRHWQSPPLRLQAAGQLQQLVPRTRRHVHRQQRIHGGGQLLDRHLDSHRSCRTLEHVFECSSAVRYDATENHQKYQGICPDRAVRDVTPNRMPGANQAVSRFTSVKERVTFTVGWTNVATRSS